MRRVRQLSDVGKHTASSGNPARPHSVRYRPLTLGWHENRNAQKR